MNVENEGKASTDVEVSAFFGVFLFLLYRKWLIVSKSNQMAGSLALVGPELLARVLRVGKTQKKSLIKAWEARASPGFRQVGGRLGLCPSSQSFTTLLVKPALGPRACVPAGHWGLTPPAAPSGRRQLPQALKKTPRLLDGGSSLPQGATSHFPGSERGCYGFWEPGGAVIGPSCAEMVESPRSQRGLSAEASHEISTRLSPHSPSHPPSHPGPELLPASPGGGGDPSGPKRVPQEGRAEGQRRRNKGP